jgi:hypothetical protein
MKSSSSGEAKCGRASDIICSINILHKALENWIVLQHGRNMVTKISMRNKQLHTARPVRLLKTADH